MRPILIAACLAFPGVLAAAPQPIFNGKDLGGWKTEGAAYWTAKDGVLTGASDEKKKASVLWTEEKFKDFTLECEFRFSGDIDSGIFLRHNTDQIQIGTSRSLKRDMTGSPYIGTVGKYTAEAQGVKELLKIGEWNRFRITAKGSSYTIELNGKKILDYTSTTAIPEGPLGLQVHPGVEMKIEFRGLKVDKLD